MTGRPHEWLSPEGGIVDIDTLPQGRVVDAAVDRLLRLRGGEQVELRSTSDPYAVWRRMNRFGAGDYGFVYLQDGPRRWRVRHPPQAGRLTKGRTL